MSIEIIKAEHMGFCFGVKRAVEKADELADKKNKTIYVLGMLVHNEFVINRLQNKNVVFLDEEKLLNNEYNLNKDDTIIIRAHGTTKNIHKYLVNLGVEVIDMSCVFVQSAKNQLVTWEKKEYTPIFIGDKDHPEVRGITSFGNNVIIIENFEKLKKSNLDIKGKYVFLFQTTFNRNSFLELSGYIEQNFENSKTLKTICSATHERQSSVEKVAKNSEIIFIIGSPKSSNTKKLFQIASSINENTFFIKGPDDINENILNRYKKIGISAGASTPDDIIEAVELKIRNLTK